MIKTLNPALEGSPLKGYLKFAIPSVIALLAMSAAPIVDGLFIANYVGIDGLAAVNLIIPVFTVVLGGAYMIAIGGSVTAGKFIGEKNQGAASDVFSKTLIVGILYSFLLLFAGKVWTEELFYLLGAQPDLFPLMHDYLDWLVWFLPTYIVGIVYYYYVRISGFPTLVSVAIVVGVLVNVVLNYILIGLLGYGMTGAALATGISSIVMLVIMLTYRLFKDSWLRFSFSKSGWRVMARAAYNGISDFMDEISGGIVAFVLNLLIIQTWGNGGVAAFSVAIYSLYVGYLFYFGLSEALQAVSSQCFGARNVYRLRAFLKINTIMVVISGALLTTILFFFGEVFIGFFIDPSEADLVALSRSFILVLSPIFIFNGLNIMISGYLTAVHRPGPSASIAVLRAMIFPLGLLYILIEFFPDVPFPAAVTGGEILALVLAVLLFIKFRPSKVVPHPSPASKDSV